MQEFLMLYGTGTFILKTFNNLNKGQFYLK